MKTDKAHTVCITYALDQVQEIARLIASLRDQSVIFTFVGSLGAGKTTLVRAILKECGVSSPITSPTFTYVNIYENIQGQTFYHFDCYRLSCVDDFVQAGFDEYLYQSNSWSFIEWPEIIEPLINHKVCRIVLEYKNENERIICYRVEE